MKLRILDSGEKFGFGTINMFKPWNVQQVSCLNDKPDLVLFGGGEDLNPAIYQHKSVIGPFPSYATDREQAEATLFSLCQEQRIPMFGICRGLQFLNVMCGGWLIQDIPFHAGQNHIIDLLPSRRGGSIIVNSCHHQVCIPNPDVTTIVAVTKNSSCFGRHKYDKTKAKLSEKFQMESVEALYFDGKTHAFGVQWHPEYYNPEHLIPTVTRSLVSSYLFNDRIKD